MSKPAAADRPSNSMKKREPFHKRVAERKKQDAENTAKAVTRLADIQRLVDCQAKDEGLWFVAETAPEAYLQQELRRLHALIEQGNRK